MVIWVVVFLRGEGGGEGEGGYKINTSNLRISVVLGEVSKSDKI